MLHVPRYIYIITIHVFFKHRNGEQASLANYRLFIVMRLVERLSIFLVHQKLLILGDFLFDSLVGCYTKSLP